MKKTITQRKKLTLTRATIVRLVDHATVAGAAIRRSGLESCRRQDCPTDTNPTCWYGCTTR